MSSLLTNHCMREIPILRAFISAERCRENGIKPTINPIMLEEDDAWVKKTEWLKSHNLVVMRCHDVWDNFPRSGIHGAWAKWLGFEDPPVSSQKFYEVHKVDNLTLRTSRRKYCCQSKKPRSRVCSFHWRSRLSSYPHCAWNQEPLLPTE